MPRLNSIKIRRGTAAAWTAANPVLEAGEPGLETDTNQVKYGDGVTAWDSLDYALNGSLDGVWLDATRFDPTGGSPVLTTVNFAWRAWAMDAATAETIGTVMHSKEFSGFSTFAVDVVWSNATAGAGDVVFRCATQAASDGDSFATVSAQPNVTATAPAQRIRKTTTLATGLTVPVDGDAMILRIDRQATDAADTLAGDIEVYGVLLRFS